MLIDFEYNIYQLGKIKADIVGEYAIDCYNFLKNKNCIEKLMNMNQLGVIPNTSLGTSHNRYEYVILQIYLINILQGKPNTFTITNNKQEKFHLGLNSNHDVKTHISLENPTGAEILIMWILLFNSGHLIGTFASEKGFLNVLRNNEDFLNKFKKYIPKSLHSSLDTYLKQNYYLDFHKFISLFIINTNKSSTKDLKNGKQSIYLFSKLIELYFISDDETILKLKKYYNKIRKLAYLFLDSQYSSIPINFTLISLLINLSENIDDLLDSNSQLNQTLNSIDKLLSYDLYYSEESISELRRHSDYIYNKLNKKVNVNKLKKEVNDIKFFNTISQPDKKFKTIQLYFEFNKLFESIYNIQFNSVLGEKWDSELGETCLLTIENNPKFDFAVLNIIYLNKNVYSQILFTARLINKLIIFKEDKFKRFKEQNETTEHNIATTLLNNYLINIFNNPFKELILFILENSTENYYYKFKENDFPIISSYNGNTIDNTFNLLNLSNLPKFRKHEKNVIKEFANKIIKSKKTKALISFSSIKSYSKSDESEGPEIDGLIMIFKNNELNLYLIEAKNKYSSSQTDSEKALEKKIKTLNFKNKKYEINSISTIKGAYTHIILSN